jgi:hypothetical protein
VVLDRRATPTRVAQQRLMAARGSLARLCEFLGVQQWSTPWTRLVLYDVYVRTQMTFAAPVCDPAYLSRGLGLSGRGPLQDLAVQYRRGLRLLLH